MTALLMPIRFPRLLIAIVVAVGAASLLPVCAGDEPALQMFVSREFVSELAKSATSKPIQLSNVPAQGWAASGTLLPNISVEVSDIAFNPFAATVDFHGLAELRNAVMCKGNRRVGLFARFRVDGSLLFKPEENSLALSDAPVRVRLLCVTARRSGGDGSDISKRAQRQMNVPEVERQSAAAIVRNGNSRLSELNLDMRALSSMLQGEAVQTDVTNGNIFAWLPSTRTVPDLDPFKEKLGNASEPRAAIRVHEDRASYLVQKWMSTATRLHFRRSWCGR